MAEPMEYALLAGASYISTRSEINRFPVPQGWTPIVDPPPFNNDANGFEAIAFQRGEEIVISFAGTAQLVDWMTNITLATGFSNGQLLDAAVYYLEVRRVYPEARISFTGHSLGGGLAALMGVLFNEPAVTFDPAPFRQSANNDRRDVLLRDLANLGYADGAAINALRAFTSSMPSTQPSEGGIRGEGGVRVIGVAGEAVSASLLLAPFRPPIGMQAPPLTHGGANVSGVDLHSQALLAAFLQSDAFRQVSLKLPDMLRMVFDSALYKRDTGTANTEFTNFLEHLVRHQAGGVSGVPAGGDKMLARFTADLQKVAQGNVTDDNFTQALIAFAMQMYYENTVAAADRDKTLYTAVSGGIRFDRNDVAATLDATKGYTLYFADYLASLPDAERNEILQQIPQLLDWHLQAGRAGMTSTAATRRAFMLGGTASDNLTGGTQNDLLVGLGDNDRLTGGTGNDILIGGEGADTYIWNAGDGDDRIVESDRRGLLMIDGRPEAVFVSEAGIWKNPAGGIVLDRAAGKLTLADGAVLDLGGPVNDGDFGIHLVGMPATPATDMALAGDLAPVDQNPALAGVQVAYDGLGNVIVDAGRPEADRADVLYGSAGADLVLARGGEDSLNGRSGADRLEGGAGGDWIEGGDGGDWLIGGGSVWGRAGRRSQSPQHGDPVAANDCEWRRTA